MPVAADSLKCLLIKDSVPVCYPLTTRIGHSLINEESRPLVAGLSFADTDTLHNEVLPKLEGTVHHLPPPRVKIAEVDPQQRIYLSLVKRKTAERHIRTRSKEEASSGLLNYNLIKDWLAHCCKKHDCGSETAHTNPRRLSLIDVTTRKIVRMPSNTRYLALSYVWGETQPYPEVSDPVTRARTSGGLLPAPLPQTIEDACRITEHLGETYLWVDAYCINQNDEVAKLEEIKQMDSLYEGAYFTIVAVSSAHANAGIAGVSRPLPLVNQPTTKIKCGTLQATFWKEFNDVAALDPWNTRAWTLQEGALSNRLLLLRDTNYTLRCRDQVYLDIMSMHYSNRNIRVGDLFNGKVIIMPWYVRAIEQYSSRRLSMPGDILHALAGLFNRLERNSGVSFSYGLPTNELFVSCLLWSRASLGRLRPRDGFPSWPWCGWAGQVDYRVSEWFENTRFNMARRDAPVCASPPNSLQQTVRVESALLHLVVRVWTSANGYVLSELDPDVHGTDPDGATVVSLDEPYDFCDGRHELDALPLQHRVESDAGTEVNPELLCLLVQQHGDTWRRIGMARLSPVEEEYQFATGARVTLD
jgi:Heterokaryon incompatibility protein (HET)